jgi:hypothetical protein
MIWLTGTLFLGLLVALACLLAAGSLLRPTTLAPAHRWAVVALLAWCAGIGGELWAIGRSRAVLDVLWYLAAVLSLCPAVAVLGAKRPGTRVWTWFVILPLTAVLTLPVLGPPLLTSAGWSIRVPLPLMLGFATVLLMGMGNYVGTRYALSATLVAVAVCLVTAPLSDVAPEHPASRESLRLWGAGLIITAVLWARRQARRKTVANCDWERIWCDYRDTFGIVWGRRLLDRVNERAAAEGWEWRLSDTGFIPVAGTQPQKPVDTDPQIAHAFRWLLRRFVDPEWIDLRLVAPEHQVELRADAHAEG